NDEELPRKMPKQEKPKLFGKVYWIRNAKGAVMIQKRVEKGLYQGLYQLPTTDWVSSKKQAAALLPPLPLKAAKNRKVTVRHSFTHFDLELEIWEARAAEGAVKTLPESRWIAPEIRDDFALPTLMTKAWKLCV